MKLEELKERLRTYDGPEVRIMEVCGSHTGAILRSGIPSLLSPRIRLLHGPGCPVCVAVSAYVDRLVELSRTPGHCVVTFGDLLRVPGSQGTLLETKSQGGRAEMVYSPLDILPLAEKDPETVFVFAALGFETTAPAYALLLQELEEGAVENVRLLTALKTMPPVIGHLLEGGADISGFLAPGHVSVIIGSEAFRPLAERFSLPFAVAGFSGEGLLAALWTLVEHQGEGKVFNLYPAVVTPEGNRAAKAAVERYLEPADASWRGLGTVPASGLVLREKYRHFDAGSLGLDQDKEKNPACRCKEVLSGRAEPKDCPLFGKACTPLTPQGACMVSEEGACAAVMRWGEV